MDLSELNIYPKLVPCKNIECDEPFSCSIETAYALLEYMTYEKPNSTFNFICSRCHNENRYTFSELLKFLPFEKRPKELPPNEVFVLILIPIKTERPMDNPAFGELVRAKVLKRNDKTIICEFLGKSHIAPTLTERDIIYCSVVSGYFYAFDWLVKDSKGDRWEPIQKIAPPKDSFCGLFFVKQDNLKNELIMPANPKCSNPSCNYIYTYTASKLQRLLMAKSQTISNFDKKYISIQCPICSTNKIITENYIKTLYPL